MEELLGFHPPRKTHFSWRWENCHTSDSFATKLCDLGQITTLLRLSFPIYKRESSPCACLWSALSCVCPGRKLKVKILIIYRVTTCPGLSRSVLVYSCCPSIILNSSASPCQKWPGLVWTIHYSVTQFIRFITFPTGRVRPFPLLLQSKY